MELRSSSVPEASCSDPEASRPVFRRLRELARVAETQTPKTRVRVLIGTKLDLGRRAVDNKAIEHFIEDFGIDAFYPVSAHTGAAVETAFAGTVQLLRDRGVAPARQKTPSPEPRTMHRRSLRESAAVAPTAAFKTLAATTVASCFACSCIAAATE